ncbi:hypothetical protein [Cardinium endosymbiont of Tipula unca]|uniref:hypothetical protein n=1 Tax=Cardinium endosymbiont of Tipula unca TaxID=3066216 RepID=UPI0030CC2F42
MKLLQNSNEQPKIKDLNRPSHRYIGQLFYVIKYCTLFIYAILFFTGCRKTNDQEDEILDDVIMQDPSLIHNVQKISWYITGTYEHTDDHDETPVSYSPDAKDIQKAHKQFRIAENLIRGYPKITKHPIARSTIEEIQALLEELMGHIKKVTNDKDKDKLINAFSKLAQCVATA